MAEKIMTVQQYAATRKVSSVAVTRAMNKGKKLIGVKSYRKIGRDWVLTVCNNVSKINSTGSVVIQE